MAWFKDSFGSVIRKGVGPITDPKCCCDNAPPGGVCCGRSPLPAQLLATITAAQAECVCLIGETFPFNLVTAFEYAGELDMTLTCPQAAGTLRLVLDCLGLGDGCQDFALDYAGDSSCGSPGSPTLADNGCTCNPLFLTFTEFNTSICCDINGSGLENITISCEEVLP